MPAEAILTPLQQLFLQKHVSLDDYWLAVSLLKVEHLGPLPHMIKAVAIEELKAFFMSKAKILMS